MDEFMSILVKAVGIIIAATVTYVIVPAIQNWRSTKLDEKQRAQLKFWVDTGVLWAKQWLQSESGQFKKDEVMKFVLAKVAALNLPYSQDDIDKAVEAAYSAVKDVISAAAGEALTTSVEIGAISDAYAIS